MTAGYRESELIWNRAHQRDKLSERERKLERGGQKKKSSKEGEGRTKERKERRGALRGPFD